MRVLSILVLLNLWSCGSGIDPSDVSDKHPFGIWTMEPDFIVKINRDGEFEFCDQDKCEKGTWQKNGNNAVFLTNFARLKATGRFRNLTGWSPSELLDNTKFASSLEIGDGGMSPSLKKSLCDGLPCKMVAFKVDGRDYAFRKIRDF
jgi:hypothetical protein